MHKESLCPSSGDINRLMMNGRKGEMLFFSYVPNSTKEKIKKLNQ
jgi:hypothetical protein